ncbi:7982_t:CDS:2 [Ambispora leptoticha]|uniref:7982_t:CDS:1 n=1 Tax=Ambispora leptoticha TaxID=144679 RepID=A0A9N9CED9_9GLOM|nr:7982_t:CDS:2 [Ambispora leptoticha]
MSTKAKVTTSSSDLNIQFYQGKIEKAIQTTNEELDKWKKFETDHLQLKSTLAELAEKREYNIMLAFMPGKLIHTNEVLALLGDNWFTECSTKHAVEIVNRRCEFVNQNIKNLETQLNDLISRFNMTSNILETNPNVLNEEGLPFVDIVEHEEGEEDEESITKTQQKPRKKSVDVDHYIKNNKLKEVVDWDALEKEEREQERKEDEEKAQISSRAKVRVINQVADSDDELDEDHQEDEEEENEDEEGLDKELDALFEDTTLYNTTPISSSIKESSISPTILTQSSQIHPVHSTLLSDNQTPKEQSIFKRSLTEKKNQTITKTSSSAITPFTGLRARDGIDNKNSRIRENSNRGPVKSVVVEKEPTQEERNDLLEDTEDELLMKEVTINYYDSKRKFRDSLTTEDQFKLSSDSLLSSLSSRQETPVSPQKPSPSPSDAALLQGKLSDK